MKAQIVREALLEGKSINFVFDALPCGVTVEDTGYDKLYHAWYGDTKIIFGNIDAVMNTQFFGNVALQELAEKTKINVS